MAPSVHPVPHRDGALTLVPRQETLAVFGRADVLDTYASLFRAGEPLTPIEFPYSPQRWPMAHADHVLLDGQPVGWSSGTAYSSRFREVISMGCIDVGATEIGTEVVVLWGDHGGPLKEIRATVERFPYLTEQRNSEVDVGSRP